MQCIAYIRVSTENQAEQGNGLEQQRRSICAYAAATGLRIDEWVVDEETGTTEDRPGIQSLMARSEASEQFVLLYDRIDRLGRTVEVFESLYKKFHQRGVKLLCVAQQLDDTPVGVAMRQMLAVIAEFQRSEMLVRLAQSKRAAKAKRGVFGGGQVPLGFSSVGGGKLAVDPVTAALVRRTHEIAQSGQRSLRQIVQQLTQEGHRTRKGTILSATQVKRILDRLDVYRGQQNVGSVPLDAGVKPQHEVILD